MGKEKKKALAFDRDRCYHLGFCLRLILFHFSKIRQNLSNEPMAAKIAAVKSLITLTPEEPVL